MASRAPKNPPRPPAKKRGKKPLSGEPLATYREKRDFATTSEPAGSVLPTGNGKYFIQKHDSSRLHYDFRLGIAGVLKSGAIPKGFPLELQAIGCPFIDLPRPRSSRWGQPLTRAEMTKCTWVRPELVCQVRFAEWTDDGILRQLAFIRMRNAKLAADVVRET